MTLRRALFWGVLVPITVGVWAQFLPPCVFGCVQTQQTVVAPSPPPPTERKRYTVCPIMGECWVVEGRRAPPVMGSP
jgi:hypothetical protein